jgi:hypothetical protein
MSKSISSLSFCTQSSASMTNSSADEISSNSNDLNEISITHHSTESIRKSCHHHHKHNNSTSDSSLNVSNRRRRKRTIFSAADIEHLKEAFIQNPKPSRKYCYISCLKIVIKKLIYSRTRYCYSI